MIYFSKNQLNLLIQQRSIKTGKKAESILPLCPGYLKCFIPPFLCSIYSNSWLVGRVIKHNFGRTYAYSLSSYKWPNSFREGNFSKSSQRVMGIAKKFTKQN